jgi:putative membrane protein
MSATPTPPADGGAARPWRVVLAGVLMGLANLVPGVSGGTMILAMGLYDRFIGALADVSRLRLSREALLFLALVAAGAGVALVGFSGLAVTLVTEHRWVMYSLFIGMTLGGAPELLAESRPLRPASLAAFLATFALMAALARGLDGAALPESAPVFVLMGMLGASSMILPGISGSYMLLIFGMYDVVVGSLSAGALREAPGESLSVLVPVGAGAALGMALFSNGLRHLLARHAAATHAALLGLLVGSVLGLWPFREPADPDLARKPFRKAVAMLLEGAELEAVEARYPLGLDEARAELVRSTYAGLGPGDLKRRGDELVRFEPTGGEVAAALGLFAAGFALTRLLGRRGGAAREAAGAERA